jgi:hypothetical protein
MGRNHTMRLQSSPKDDPNPGRPSSSLPSAPMRIDKGGIIFPEMQPFFGMLKKNNIAIVAIAL